MSIIFTKVHIPELTELLRGRGVDNRNNLTFMNCTLSVESWKGILMDLIDGKEISSDKAKSAENAAQLVTLMISSMDPNSGTTLEVMKHENGKTYMCAVTKTLSRFYRALNPNEPNMTPLFEIMDVVDRQYLVEKGRFTPAE